MLVLLTFNFLSRRFRLLSGFCPQKLGSYQDFVLVFQFLSGFCTGFSVSIRSLSSFFRPVGAAVSYYFRPVGRLCPPFSDQWGAALSSFFRPVGAALSCFSACGEYSNRCRNTLRRRYSTIKWNGWQGATAAHPWRASIGCAPMEGGGRSYAWRRGTHPCGQRL